MLPELGSALPLEYLERLSLQNRLFSDTIRFVGIGGARHAPRIITRQEDVSGEPASESEIRTFMAELSFEELPPRFSLGYSGSLAFARNNAAVFDLRPANVVRMDDGLIVPIDVIACSLDPTARAILSLAP